MSSGMVFFIIAILICFVLIMCALEEAWIMPSLIILGVLVWGVIWGVICKSIVKSKGYPDDENSGFWWGFLLGLLGLIVCAVKPNYLDTYKGRQIEAVESNAAQSTVSNSSVAEELKKFKELYDQGVLSEQEFQAQKEKLLNKM